MDEMQMVRQLLEVPPAPLAVRDRVRQLTLAGGGRAESRRSRRTAYGLGAVAAVAAVAAAAVAVATVGTGASGKAPNAEKRVGLSADSIFLAAVTKAAQQPTGSYWYSDSVGYQSYLVLAKSGDYAIAAAGSESFEWTAAKVGGGQLFSGRDLPARPLTGADVAAWRRAGSPKSFRVWSNDHYQTYTQALGPWQADHPQAQPGGRFGFPGFKKAGASKTGATIEELNALPTDPGKLAALLFSDRTAPAAIGPQKIMAASGALSAPIPSKVRAGIMRALAAQPEVHKVGTVTDPFGRKGVALAAEWPQRTWIGAFTFKGIHRPGHWNDRGFTAREELIFNPDTGALLAEQQILVKPGGIYKTAKPGFVIDYSVSRGSGWTDHKPTPPARPPF
jgi:hypothetical protein